jgi:GTP pyrophosphokinase
MLTQALRAEGIDKTLAETARNKQVWDKLLRFSGNKSQSELLTDIGLGKRIASIVAKRLRALLTDSGEKLDAVLLTRERFAMNQSGSQGGVMLDGSENASVSYARCCRPIPGDAIVGYLGRGEGLIVHVEDCAVARKLKHKDSERFIGVEWSDEPLRPFESEVVVTVTNGKGVLARVAAALAAAEVDIARVDIPDEATQEAIELRFLIAVRDGTQLDAALRNLRRTPSVLKAERTSNSVSVN